MSITWVKGGFLLAKRGCEGGKVLEDNNALRALTGQRKWLSIDGI